MGSTDGKGGLEAEGIKSVVISERNTEATSERVRLRGWLVGFVLYPFSVYVLACDYYCHVYFLWSGYGTVVYNRLFRLSGTVRAGCRRAALLSRMFSVYYIT